MRNFSLLILFLIWSATLFAQAPAMGKSENIVPNPSFEKYASTPIGWFYKGKHFTDVMKYWSSATGSSPDVFGSKIRVPAHWASKGFGQRFENDVVCFCSVVVFYVCQLKSFRNLHRNS